jgi:hypothetical protein
MTPRILLVLLPLIAAMVGCGGALAPCEDGLTWQGCCGTAANPQAHRCGDPSALCEAKCSAQQSCVLP